MRYVWMIAIVLCGASVGFSAETYDAGTKTLTVTADSLAAMVDPVGQGQDWEANYIQPAMTKDAFNALAGLKTVTFNGALDDFQVTATIKAYYDAANYVTFTGFGDPNGYNYGGGTSQGRYAFSGTEAMHQLGLVEGTAAGGPFRLDPNGGGVDGHNWLKMSISVSQAGKGVTAIGFIIDGRDTTGNYTQDTNIYIDLSDSTTVQQNSTGKFAGDVATDPKGLFFGYQAPEGTFITGIECTRLNMPGSSYLALDDLTFVIGGSASNPIGDINGDGAVGVPDLQALVAAWTSQAGPPPVGNWNAAADLNGDGHVNVGDLQILIAHWGEHN